MSETKRRILIIVVLVLVVLFGVGQFFAGSLTPPASQSPTTPANTVTTPTQVIAFAASVPASSTPVEQGSCFTNSIAAPYRSDAWRCTVGNAISDPCFVILTGVSTLSVPEPNLICGVNPAVADSSSTFVLQLTKPLPTSTIPSGTVPLNWAWEVQLVDGTICTPFTGTLPFTANGDVAHYSCNGPAGENMIFGDINNASSVWMAEVGALSTATSTYPPVIISSSTVPVSIVWQ
jgi:hypothetical protein